MCYKKELAQSAIAWIVLNKQKNGFEWGKKLKKAFKRPESINKCTLKQTIKHNYKLLRRYISKTIKHAPTSKYK